VGGGVALASTASPPASSSPSSVPCPLGGGSCFLWRAGARAFRGAGGGDCKITCGTDGSRSRWTPLLTRLLCLTSSFIAVIGAGDDSDGDSGDCDSSDSDGSDGDGGDGNGSDCKTWDFAGLRIEGAPGSVD
jgi:hypothetical protein